MSRCTRRHVAWLDEVAQLFCATASALNCQGNAEVRRDEFPVTEANSAERKENI